MYHIFHMVRILEGKTLSKKILDSLPPRIEKIKSVLGRPPFLAIINYYGDSPSGIYVRKKMKACEKLGISAKIIMPDEKRGPGHLRETVLGLCADDSVDAIMVERPLPTNCERLQTFDFLCPGKDVDAVSSVNMGRLSILKSMAEISRAGFFVPCTALAVVKLIEEYGLETRGENIAVLGRSATVGRPLAHMLCAMDATVTVCHSKTRDFEKILSGCDMAIVAVGKARFLKGDAFSGKCTVIDVGTNIDESGKICGDVDFESAKERVAAITPVPGGVGPVTLACLIEASVRAAEKRM